MCSHWHKAACNNRLPRTNEWTDGKYNQTLEKRLRHFVNEHQSDWDLYVQPLTYAYNDQVHRSTGTSPFSLVLTRHLPSTIIETTATGTDRLNDIKTTQSVRDNIIKRMSTMFDKTDRRMYMAQQNYKRNYEKSVREIVQYKVGDYVFIDRPKGQQRTTQEDEDAINISKLYAHKPSART